MWLSFGQWNVNRSIHNSWEVSFSVSPEWNTIARAGTQQPPWTLRIGTSIYRKLTKKVCWSLHFVEPLYWGCPPLDVFSLKKKYISVLSQCKNKVCIFCCCCCCVFLQSAKLNHNGHRLVYYHLPSVVICGNMKKWPHCGEQSQEAFWSWFIVYSCLFLPYVVSWDPGPANVAHKKWALLCVSVVRWVWSRVRSPSSLTWRPGLAREE